jgi:hypothetical protein
VADRNHELLYDPLRPGAQIFNPDVGRPGTIGLFLIDNAGAPWLLSARHVLVPAAATSGPGTVFQPLPLPLGRPIATLAGVRQDTSLDCAAVRLVPGITFSNDILSIGPAPGPPVAPAVGMNLLKSGAASGVSEGVITQAGETSEIRLRPATPTRYELTTRGDSGCIWVEQATRRPVILHHTGESSGQELSKGSSLVSVLQALGLTLPP